MHLPPFCTIFEHRAGPHGIAPRTFATQDSAPMTSVSKPRPGWLGGFAPAPGGVPASQPCFCEENALRRALAEALDAEDPDAEDPGAEDPDGEGPGADTIAVVFVLNRAGAVLFFAQRAVAPGEPMVWDYHVVVLMQGRVLDPDCRAGADLPLAQWLAASFPHLRDPSPEFDAWRPAFRPVPLAGMLRDFSSDRRHMRDALGHWIQPPPPWLPPSPTPAGEAHTLPRFLDPDDALAGPLLDAEALLSHPAARQSASPRRAP
jgi:hypothetical protein